jgi:hypothetical protein
MLFITGTFPIPATEIVGRAHPLIQFSSNSGFFFIPGRERQRANPEPSGGRGACFRIPGSRRSLPSGRARRGPVGRAPE